MSDFKSYAYKEIAKLQETKIQIMSGSMMQFIGTFSKIKPIEFSKITIDENIFDNENFNS